MVPALKEAVLHVKDVQVPKVKPQYDVYWETTSFDFTSPLDNNDDYVYLDGVSWGEYDVYNGSWEGASLTVKVDGETYVFPFDNSHGSNAEFWYNEDASHVKDATGLVYVDIDPIKGNYYLCRYYDTTYTPGSQHTIQFISLETATAVYNIKQM